MADYNHTASNFVEPDPTYDNPAASLVRREDVSAAVSQLLTTYEQQQRVMLGSLAPHTSGALSDAGAIAERRRTTGLYLAYYSLVIAAAVGGILGLVRLAGVVGNGEFFALWIAVTGILALYLAWLRHGQELENSPEGIANHVIDAGTEVLLYRAETERLALGWESEANDRRLDLAEAQAAQAREAAQLRLAEVEYQREARAAQQARLAVAEAPPPPMVDTFAAAFLEFIAGLYDRKPDGSWLRLTVTGVVDVTVPWAARGSWTPADRARAVTVLAAAPVFDHTGNRWRLRIDEYPTAETALAVLGKCL